MSVVFEWVQRESLQTRGSTMQLTAWGAGAVASWAPGLCKLSVPLSRRSSHTWAKLIRFQETPENSLRLTVNEGVSSSVQGPKPAVVTSWSVSCEVWPSSCCIPVLGRLLLLAPALMHNAAHGMITVYKPLFFNSRVCMQPHKPSESHGSQQHVCPQPAVLLVEAGRAFGRW